jgi:hypothetical protein
MYVVNGSSTTAPSLHEAVEALLVDDDGHLLFSVAGVGPEEDGGVPLETGTVRPDSFVGAAAPASPASQGSALSGRWAPFLVQTRAPAARAPNLGPPAPPTPRPPPPRPQDDRLGPVIRMPELQFLNKNSKFRAGGR